MGQNIKKSPICHHGNCLVGELHTTNQLVKICVSIIMRSRCKFRVVSLNPLCPGSPLFNWLSSRKSQNVLIPFQSSFAFHIEISHLICNANQMTGFCVKCNTGLQWVMTLAPNIVNFNIFRFLHLRYHHWFAKNHIQESGSFHMLLDLWYLFDGTLI